MGKPASILMLSALILAGSLFTASDVRAGAALDPPIKTTGASLSATIVVDVTESPAFVPDAITGLSSIKVQKASASTAALFTSTYIGSAQWTSACTKPNSDLRTTVAIRFTGLINGFVDNQDALNALFSKFGNPSKATIVDQDYVQCTAVGNRRILSFTAVIQFDVGF